MAGHTSRKAVNSIENTYRVLAYELMIAVRAFDFTTEQPLELLNSLIKDLKQLDLSNNGNNKIDTNVHPYLNSIIDFIKNIHIDKYLID